MSRASDPSQVFAEEGFEPLIRLESALLGLEETPGDGEPVATAFIIIPDIGIPDIGRIFSAE